MIFDIKKYVITTAKEIPCLGGITGPITTPVRLEFNDLTWLLNNGFTVYQCNPYDVNDRVLVTRMNMNNITFERNREVVTSERIENIKGQEMTKPIEPIKKDNKMNSEQENKKDEKKNAPEKVVEADTFQKK